MIEAQSKRLKQAVIFFFILAFLTAIMALPYVGYLISIMSIGTVHLILLAFAIVTLIFALRASAPRTGTMLVMIAVIPGIISAVLMYNGIKIGERAGLNIAGPLEAYQGMYAGDLTVFLVGFNIGLISWVCYVLAAGLLFLNLYNVIRRYRGIKAGYAVSPMEETKPSRFWNDEKVEQAMGFKQGFDERDVTTEVRSKSGNKKNNENSSKAKGTKNEKEKLADETQTLMETKTVVSKKTKKSPTQKTPTKKLNNKSNEKKKPSRHNDKKLTKTDNVKAKKADGKKS